MPDTDTTRTHFVAASAATEVRGYQVGNGDNNHVDNLGTGPMTLNPLPYPATDYFIQGTLTQKAYQDLDEWILPKQTKNRKGQWNAFQHYKMTVSPPSVSVPIVLPTGAYVTGWPNVYNTYHVFYVSGIPLWGSRGFGIDSGEMLNSLPAYTVAGQSSGLTDPENLKSWLDDAVKSIMPNIKSNLSLVNSVIELKDFASLPKTLIGLKNFLFLGGKTIREFFRVGSDAYLQMQFNIKPVLSDVSGIYQALRQVEARMNELITRSGSVRCDHRSHNIKEFDDLDDSFDYTIGSYPAVLGGCRSHRRVLNRPTQFHVMIEYNYNYTQYQREHARVLALLDYFGVNLNPAIVWNAIPWSFLVDWTVGVSRWLDQFKIQNMSPVINIRRCLWSVKRSRVATSAFTLGLTQPPTPPLVHSEQTPGLTYTESAYKRGLFMPSLSSLTASGLTSSEVSLGAALVLAKRRRRH